MYNDNFLFNYMFLRSNKKFVSSSKAASLALQSSAFTTSPVGGFMTANNMLKAEKASKQKKDAIRSRELASKNLSMLEQSFAEAPNKAKVEEFIRDNLGSTHYRIALAKAAKVSLDNVFTDKDPDEIAQIKIKLGEAGGVDKMSYEEIKEKFGS